MKETLMKTSVSLLGAFLAAACTGGTPSPPPPAAPSAKQAPVWTSLDQGWTADEAQAFWFTSQGSMLVPYRWFLVLEQAGSEAPLRDDLARLGYLEVGPSAGNPDGLPIGFVKDRQKQGDHEMLGLNCAACHTTRLEAAGAVVQVEGGPSLADFGALLDGLVASLEATRADGAKYQRFAQALVGEASGTRASALRSDLDAFTKALAERKRRNDPPHPYGRGRVDALGNILNEVMANDLGVPENRQEANAPVSYPVIWDAHQHDFVQWNGSAPNAGPGPLLRNIGEVLGVFGHMEFTPRRGRFPIYRNATADVENLKALEAILTKLQSPLWPASFPAIDAARAAAGKAIYAKHCQGCHAPIERTDPNRRIKAHMVEAAHVGTDPMASGNFVKRRARTGALEGTPVFVNLLQGFGDTAPAGEILRNAVFGVQLGKFGIGLPRPHGIEMPAGGLPALLESHWQALEQKVKDQRTMLETLVAGNPRQLTVAMYKARPLNGVWASAPYLHNGSVPTLAQMLTPPPQRVKRFFVGSRQYDPVDVGVRSLEAEGGVAYFAFDTSLPANSNAGHPFGTDLADDEKRQLIEYLKTL
jgi:mono/diheme cytochrome c family protein